MTQGRVNNFNKLTPRAPHGRMDNTTFRTQTPMLNTSDFIQTHSLANMYAKPIQSSQNPRRSGQPTMMSYIPLTNSDGPDPKDTLDGVRLNAQNQSKLFSWDLYYKKRKQKDAQRIFEKGGKTEY